MAKYTLKKYGKIYFKKGAIEIAAYVYKYKIE